MKTAEIELDHVDRFLERIRTVRPDLDLTVEGIVDRIMGLSRRLNRTLDETLAEQDLSHGEYKVLGLLRWAGEPPCQSPGELAEHAELSSGAMTNRLDRLEAAGLVKRLPDPNDRRGVQVELTPKGREAYDSAVSVQAAKEALFTSALDEPEKEQLFVLLRRLMLEFERRERKA